MRYATSSIELKRRSGYWADRLRAYKVIVDRQIVASVDEGASQTIRVAPGPHTMHLRIDFCRSRLLNMDVRPDETIVLSCWPNAKWYTWPFFLSLGRAHYIALALEGREPSPTGAP